MPTRNVNLSEAQADFIRQSIDVGRFRNVSEVVRAGLRLLEQEEEQNKLKLKHLRRLVKEGFQSIDRRQFEMLTPDSLEAFLKTVAAPARKRKSA